MIYEVDEEDNLLGMREREEFYSGNYIHRASQLILLNAENKMLIQKRAPCKVWYPNRYTYSVSGTVRDESYETCLEREMLEEIGIQVTFRRLFKLPCIYGAGRAFHTVFMGRCSEEIENLIVLDPEETASIRWVSLDELHAAIKTNPEIYTPSLKAGILKIFKDGYEKYIF
jgi:isopentenyldiphosphate isomerase